MSSFLSNRSQARLILPPKYPVVGPQVRMGDFLSKKAQQFFQLFFILKSKAPALPSGGCTVNGVLPCFKGRVKVVRK